MQPDEYRKLAEVEDSMWYFKALRAHCLKGVSGVSSSGRPLALLDAGCGTGGFLRMLDSQRPSWATTGIDASPEACALASGRTRARILEGRLEALPFESGAFDAVVSADVLYHLEDDRTALRELRRVLRAGGRLVVNVPAYAWLWSYHDVATESKRRYGRAELRAKLSEAGFVIRRITHWNTLLFPLIVARRKLLPAPQAGSDVQGYSPAGNAVLGSVMALERGWLASGLPLPFGSSLFVVSDAR